VTKFVVPMARVVGPPNPYPAGDPCGIAGHFVWCRCEKPHVDQPAGYGPGHPEYERAYALNKAYAGANGGSPEDSTEPGSGHGDDCA